MKRYLVPFSALLMVGLIGPAGPERAQADGCNQYCLSGWNSCVMGGGKFCEDFDDGYCYAWPGPCVGGETMLLPLNGLGLPMNEEVTQEVMVASREEWSRAASDANGPTCLKSDISRALTLAP